jgi:hypothetical protein
LLGLFDAGVLWLKVCTGTFATPATVLGAGSLGTVASFPFAFAALASASASAWRLAVL